MGGCRSVVVLCSDNRHDRYSKLCARLSQRERKCIGCRENIAQVVDSNGKVFQHYEWTRWWRKQSRPLSA